MNTTTPEGYDRLKVLVAEAHRTTYQTNGGQTKAKTRKQLEIDKAVAEAVVRFAFDHAGFNTNHLAPTGLYLELMGR